MMNAVEFAPRVESIRPGSECRTSAVGFILSVCRQAQKARGGSQGYLSVNLIHQESLMFNVWNYPIPAFEFLRPVGESRAIQVGDVASGIAD